MRGAPDDAPSGAFPAPESPKTALVTGGGQRIGRACCLALASAGYAVAVHYHRSAAAAEATAAELCAAGGKAVALAADLTDEAQVAALLPRAAQALGAVGVLVNNASVFEGDTIDTTTREGWDTHMAVNLRAPFVLIQEFARHLPKEAGGNVINLLDERVWNLTPYFVSYTLTKAGLWTLTQTMALALAPRIRVNGIGPGPALPSPRQSHEQFMQQCLSMPLQRGTGPREVAAALRFILDAPAMTGQMIALDGGQHLGWAQPRQSAVVE